MTNTPIIEEGSSATPAKVEILDLKQLQRPSPAVQYDVTKAYNQENSKAIDLLDEFLDTNWHCKREDMSHSVKIIIKIMTDYIEKMGPGSNLTPPEKARQQTQLYKAIIHALNSEPDQSLIALRIIMFLINGYKQTIFSDRCALEATDLTAFTRDEHRTFRSLLMLFIATANPITRKQVLKRQVDLSKVVKTLQTQQMQDALIRFYNII